MLSTVCARARLGLALAAIVAGLGADAQAQTAEAIAAASKAGESIMNQGLTGAFLVLSLLVNGFLFWKLDRLSTSLMREVITALQANTAATAAGNLTIVALKDALETTDNGIEKLSHQLELSTQSAQSRGEEILGNQRNVLGRIEGLQPQLSKIDGLKENVDFLRSRA